MSKETGGPAFPLQSIGPEFQHGYEGMTLRDYFAAKIAEGDAGTEDGWGNGATDEQMAARAKLYYRIADAMLKARNV